MSNAYTVLGVARDATAQEIRSAYRARARELHPDRHVRPDGTVPREAHEAFCELTTAFRAALAARARTPVGGPVPRQRQSRETPRQRVPRRPLREVDPMLAFLTLPQRCHQEWPAEALATWGLTLAPAAREHLESAERHALACGVTGQRAYVAATNHALLTLTLQARRGRLTGLTADRIAVAYAFLEASLPPDAVVGLPARATRLDRTVRRAWLPVVLGAGAVAALAPSGDLLAELFG